MRDIVLAWRQNRRAAGRHLRRLREEAGLTQLDLAARTGLANDTICRIELGYRAPQEHTIQRLAQGLEMSPKAFIEDLPAPRPFSSDRASAPRSPGDTTMQEEAGSNP